MQGQENEARSGAPGIDTGLSCLSLVLSLLKIPAKTDVIRRSVGQFEPFKAADIIQGARLCGAQAQAYRIDPARIDKLSMPFIACLNSGEFVVVAGFEEGRILLRDPQNQASTTVSLEEFAQGWSGDCILIKPDSRASESGKPDFGRFGLNWFVPQLWRYKGAFSNVLVASLLIQVFALITPLFTMLVIDKVLSTSSISTLDVLVLGLAAIAIFDLVIGGLRSHLLGNLTNRVDSKLVASVFQHMLRLPLSFFTARRTGDTVGRMRELEAIRNFYTGPALTAVIDFPFTFVFLLVMFLFSPALTLLVIGAMIALLLLYGLVGGVLREQIRRRSSAQADSQSFLVESVSSVEMFKSLGLEPQMQRQWENTVVASNAMARQTEQLNHGLNQAAGFINKIVIALSLWIGAKAVLAGDMTAGQLIGFNMMISRVLSPAMRIAQLFQHFQQTSVSMQRVAEIFQAQPECDAPDTVRDLPAIRGKVAFENVSFAYGPDSPNILEDISFAVEPGEVIGIVGISGAGKTTLMRLLQRLYVPQKGRVLVDGINIAQVDPSWLRRQIGVVPQDTVLLNRTIRENIAIAAPGMRIEQIEAAARLAGADDFIRALPKAYDTVVGERGTSLSMGQRQRIALARALATNPKLLILDEATSSLDLQAEQRVQNNMRNIVQGRTVFIIAHRLSSLTICNRIIVLKDGRVVESGPLKELLGSGGAFSELYASQLALLGKQRAETGAGQAVGGLK